MVHWSYLGSCVLSWREGGLDVGMDGGREKVVDECKYKVEGGKVMMVAFVVVHVVILVVKVVTGLSLLWMMAKE